MSNRTALGALERDGFALARGVFTPAEVAAVVADLTAALNRAKGDAVRRSERGHAFAARDLFAVCPAATNIWRRPPLTDWLAAVLGDDYGLVRGLFFDKPPEQTWSLPWHQDMTVAVRDNRLPLTQFAKPTTKVGIPHLEAPVTVLERMLTARIHLDAAEAANGALAVIPGSHADGKRMPSDDRGTVLVECAAGDVLLMRPLLVHASGKSDPACERHRRVVHLEFAADRELPDGVAWRDFVR